MVCGYGRGLRCLEGRLRARLATMMMRKVTVERERSGVKREKGREKERVRERGGMEGGEREGGGGGGGEEDVEGTGADGEGQVEIMAHGRAGSMRGCSSAACLEARRYTSTRPVASDLHSFLKLSF